MLQESFPIVLSAAAASGYAVGTALDLLALRRHDKTAEPLNEMLPNAVPMHSERRRMGKIVSGVGALCMSAGAFIGLAVEGQSQSVQPATVQVVVDHSGPTTRSFNGQSAYNTENQFITKFDTEINASTNYLSSKLGTFSILSKGQVLKETAYGDANLHDAISSALKQTAKVETSYLKEKNNRNTGIVVLTNGNNIGDSKSILDEATAQGKTPIFVVNVRAQNKNQDTVKNLQDIAVKSGGKYWDSKTADAENIASAVEKTIQPTVEKKAKKHPGAPLYLALAGICLGAGAAQLRRNATVRVSKSVSN